MNIREKIETKEKQILCEFASLSSNSKGRVKREKKMFTSNGFSKR